MTTMLFTIEDQVACVEREIRQRHRVYGRLVSSGKLRKETADREIAAMQAVLETLKHQQNATLLL